MIDSEPVLSIYVIGSSIGESIVLSLPDGRWGVIDCYTSSLKDPADNPTLAFLKSNLVHELEFLCLTHPHYDHYRGMSQLLENLDMVRWWWQFDGLSGKELAYLIHSLRESNYDLEGDELEYLLTLVEELRRKKGLRKKYASDVKPMYPHQIDLTSPADPEQVYIFSISPPSESVDRYYHELIKCFDSNHQLRQKIPNQRHNNVSMALLINFGDTRIVLGGDVESRNWKSARDAIMSKDLEVCGVKVSHHGSETGYVDGLWEQFSSSGLPVSVITPFVRKGLPRLPVVKHINSCSSSVLTTSSEAVNSLWHDGFDNQPSRNLEIFSGLMQRKCKSFKWHTGNKVGICALKFDNRGNYTYDTLGGAGEIELANE